jgi:hypothetical protein
MTQAPFVLTERQIEIVTSSMVLEAARRGWKLYAINVRTNHVDVVMRVAGATGRVPPDLKRVATIALENERLIGTATRVCSRGATIRALPTPAAVDAACAYVVEGQGIRLGQVGDET